MTEDPKSTERTPATPEGENRAPFEDPKLTYVRPELRERGKVADVTRQGAFFGTFSP